MTCDSSHAARLNLVAAVEWQCRLSSTSNSSSSGQKKCGSGVAGRCGEHTRHDESVSRHCSSASCDPRLLDGPSPACCVTPAAPAATFPCPRPGERPRHGARRRSCRLQGAIRDRRTRHTEIVLFIVSSGRGHQCAHGTRGAPSERDMAQVADLVVAIHVGDVGGTRAAQQQAQAREAHGVAFHRRFPASLAFVFMSFFLARQYVVLE